MKLSEKYRLRSVSHKSISEEKTDKTKWYMVSVKLTNADGEEITATSVVNSDTEANAKKSAKEYFDGKYPESKDYKDWDIKVDNRVDEAKELDKDTITEDDFKSYNRVREQGKYNMVMDSDQAMDEAGLDPDTYWSIIKNYSYLSDKFKKNEDFKIDPTDAFKSKKHSREFNDYIGNVSSEMEVIFDEEDLSSDDRNPYYDALKKDSVKNELKKLWSDGVEEDSAAKRVIEIVDNSNVNEDLDAEPVTPPTPTVDTVEIVADVKQDPSSKLEVAPQDTIVKLLKEVKKLLSEMVKECNFDDDEDLYDAYSTINDQLITLDDASTGLVESLKDLKGMVSNPKIYESNEKVIKILADAISMIADEDSEGDESENGFGGSDPYKSEDGSKSDLANEVDNIYNNEEPSSEETGAGEPAPIPGQV